MNKNLTTLDVQRLLSEPTAENRAAAAEKVCEQFSTGNLTEEEREIAEEIFKVMVKDAEIRVREALSQSLKKTNNISHDVAMALANDVVEVSAPMLEFSEVLTDDDLEDIIKNRDEEAQKAVASRANISSKLADSIVENSKNASVVATLVENDGADIQENTLEKVLDKYGDDESVNAPLAKRDSLPVNVAERLVNLVSEKVRDHIVTHHEISSDTAMDIFFNARERAIANLIHEEGNKEEGSKMDFTSLVDQLHENGRLTETLIFRALCSGDVIFFEAALSKLANIPMANAYQLIHDRGDLGLRAIFDKCGFSKDMIPVVTAALEVAEEMKTYTEATPKQYRSRMVELILTKCETTVDLDSLDYFLTQIVGDEEAA